MFEKILIATDGSKHSERAAEAGIEMAKLTKGKITALYIADIGKEYAPIGDMSVSIADEMIESIRNSMKQQGDAATKRVEKMALKAGVPAERRVIEGHPADDIMKLADDAKMDLIVMGSIGVTGLTRFLLGSVAEKVIRNSRVPVLIVYGE